MIPMPSDRERRAAVSTIVQKAEFGPHSFFADACGVVRHLGPRQIFAGCGEALFLAAAAAGAAVLMLLPFMHDKLYSTVFLISPLLYLLSLAFEQVQESSTRVSEITAACKITVRHLHAIRMALFSGGCLLLNTALMLLLCAFSREPVEPMRLLSVSCCALLFFALLGGGGLSYGWARPAILWALLAVFSSLPTGGLMEAALTRLPLLALYAMAAGLAVLCLYGLKRFYLRKGGRSYAFGL